MQLDDDSPISDDCIAFRLVRPDWITPDRPSSAAFQDHPDDGQMSVFLSDGIADAGCLPEQLVTELPGYKICRLTVGELRELGEVVTRSKSDFFPGHANCKNANGDRSGSVRKKLAKRVKWLELD